MTKFPRLLTAMVTPFKDDLSVDFNGAQKLAIKLLENGCEGLVIAGTTGESPTLSINEKIELFAAVKEAVGDKGPIIAGTGTNSTADCLRLTEEASKLNIDGVMVVVPYYNKPNQEGLYQHFKAVSETTSLPIILYNVPGRTAINLEPQTVARLSEIKNIVALKEAAGNIEQVSKLKTLLPSDFILYSGDDSMTLPMLSIGGYGVISVAAHVVASQMNKMIYAYVNGQIEEAKRIHLELFPLFKSLFITANPIPVKKALNLLGLPAGKLRLPLIEASAEQTEIIRDSLISLNLI